MYFASVLNGTTAFIHVMSLIKTEILSNSTPCTHVVDIVDSSQADTFYDKIHLNVKVKSNLAEDQSLVPSLLNQLNSTNLPSFVFFHKHHRPCSLVFYNITQFLGPNHVEEWPSIEYPGHPHNDYIVFIAENLNTPTSDLLDFAKTTRKIRQAFFILPAAVDSFDIYVRSTTADELLLVSNYAAGDSTTNLLNLGTSTKPNFQGAPLIAKVCATCGDSMEDFVEEKIWYDFTAGVIYELCLRVNATPELEAVFSLPSDGIDENGEFNDWVQPLVDGSAALSTILTYSTLGRQVLQFTRPIAFDSCCFITAKPSKAKNPEILSRLISPLSSGVWLGFGISVIVLFILIEGIIRYDHFETSKSHVIYVRSSSAVAMGPLYESCLPAHLPRLTLAALLKPTIDQSPISSSVLEKEIERKALSRSILAVWLLMVIVLGSGYKSKLTSSVVMPSFTNPPSTFKELADSSYNIFAVFWADNIEKGFESMKNNYSLNILKRVKEYDYFENDCYHAIFEGDNACIGYAMLFEQLSLAQLTDDYGQYMFSMSKQTLFPVTMNWGVSLYYLSLYGIVNDMIRWLENTGVIWIWKDNLRQWNKCLGKKNAIKRFQENPKWSPHYDDGDNFPYLIMQLVVFGMMISTVVFIAEVLSLYFHRKLWKFRLLRKFGNIVL